MRQDEWANRDEMMRCRTCLFFVRKGNSNMGRCRRHAPTMNGYPPVFLNGWCGDHKLSEKASLNSTLEDNPLLASESETVPTFVNTEKAGGSVQLKPCQDTKMGTSRKLAESARFYRKSGFQD